MLCAFCAELGRSAYAKARALARGLLRGLSTSRSAQLPELHQHHGRLKGAAGCEDLNVLAGKVSLHR